VIPEVEKGGCNGLRSRSVDSTSDLAGQLTIREVNARAPVPFLTASFAISLKAGVVSLSSAPDSANS
jgi:hypothetical protein